MRTNRSLSELGGRTRENFFDPLRGKEDWAERMRVTLFIRKGKRGKKKGEELKRWRTTEK